MICRNIVVRSTLLERIKEAQKGDPVVYKWCEKVQRGELPEFCLGSDGVLRFRNRVVVPSDDGIKRKILEDAHHSKYSIHPVSNKMYRDSKQLHWWDNMKKEIAQFVQTYLVCQQVKAEYQKLSGLL